jgi:adenine-specific DNA methylase
MNQLPKRLIEVDLPIRRISEHARREKSIRHGHISTLHIWWARRPLAACRAVICAALWPDPADELCPARFRDKARTEMLTWTLHERQCLLSAESRKRFEKARQKPGLFDDAEQLRGALLDFIADFANWDNSTRKEYLATSRALTQAAHEALGGPPGTVPLIVDPFAGGGSIPLEALRVGADAYASDLNPVAVLLNKVVLEYVPKYGRQLADAVHKWGEWVRCEAEKELHEFYPKDSDGSTPIAYLWARVIRCEGPGCGVEVPLMNQLWIGKKRGIAAKLVLEGGKIAIRITDKNSAKSVGNGTVQNARITCPACGFTMSAERYRERASNRQITERMYCTVLSRAGGSRKYREPSLHEKNAFSAARKKLELVVKSAPNTDLPLVPVETPSKAEPRRLNILQYGFHDWGSLYNPRQLLSIVTFSRLLNSAFDLIKQEHSDEEFAVAISTVLGLCLSNILQYNCSMSTWLSDGMISIFIQSSSIPMRADYAEANPLMKRLVGGFEYQLTRTVDALQHLCGVLPHSGVTGLGSATRQLLPNESVDALVTDPPYYFAIPYAELSDFFYVWIKRFLMRIQPEMTAFPTTPKEEEAIQNLPHSKGEAQKDRDHFETKICESLAAARSEVKANGIGVVVFAHASTQGWEALLSALLKADWVITGSWPIDTEREGRMLASRQRTLASSVHLACRPRESLNGSVRKDVIGDWRDILQELPRRIHEWMPRLAQEGVVGADAIFACLGPALEVFSRYTRVEKASGEAVILKEYLEYVWAAVAKEALTMVFEGADATGFEPDARLTAMWLWTLKGNTNGTAVAEEPNKEDDEAEAAAKKATARGFTLEYDAARKIAQGLGAHLEDLGTLVEISGETARLLPVAERAHHLFGKDEGKVVPPKRNKREPQMDLFRVLDEASDKESSFAEVKASRLGETILDRVHQSMILFATNRNEALKRFLVDEGVGSDQRFWRLGQALAALYPRNTEEKRWAEGIMARKKGLGF